ncbi:MAG: YiiD C-terminal domain-containing protein [Spirochaetota bacterium]
MDFPQLPLADFLGLKDDPVGRLTMPRADQTLNHVGMAHAGAQFVLAETASGKCLQATFPELYGNTLPVLRKAEVKYRGPAMTDLSAHATIAPEDMQRFRKEFDERGRSMILVNVRLVDTDGKDTFRGAYEWYVQGLA